MPLHFVDQRSVWFPEKRLLEPILDFQSSIAVEIAAVAGDESEITSKGDTRQPDILQGEVLSFCHQWSQEVCGGQRILLRERHTLKTIENVILNPRPQRGGFGRSGGSKTQFKDCDGADVKMGVIFPAQPSHDFNVRRTLDDFADDIGIEQEHRRRLLEVDLALGGWKTSERTDFLQGRKKGIVSFDGIFQSLYWILNGLGRVECCSQRILDQRTQRLSLAAGLLFRQAQKSFIHIKDCLHILTIRSASVIVNVRCIRFKETSCIQRLY